MQKNVMPSWVDACARRYPIAITMLLFWAAWMGVYYLVPVGSPIWRLPEWLHVSVATLALLCIVFMPIFAGYGVAMAAKGLRRRWLGVTDTIALVVSFLYWMSMLSISFNYWVYLRG